MEVKWEINFIVSLVSHIHTGSPKKREQCLRFVLRSQVASNQKRIILATIRIFIPTEGPTSTLLRAWNTDHTFLQVLQVYTRQLKLGRDVWWKYMNESSLQKVYTHSACKNLPLLRSKWLGSPWLAWRGGGGTMWQNVDILQ